MQPVPGLRLKEKEENDSTKAMYVPTSMHTNCRYPSTLSLLSGILLILLQGACQHTTHTTPQPHVSPHHGSNAGWVPRK
jgi:hypothetical protein